MINYKKDGDLITYAGGCDIIRMENHKWSEFKETELIPDKKYEIITQCCMQRVFIKDENGKPIADDSGTRYRYFKIMNEENQPIYVWDGFFNDTVNL